MHDKSFIFWKEKWDANEKELAGSEGAAYEKCRRERDALLHNLIASLATFDTREVFSTNQWLTTALKNCVRAAQVVAPGAAPDPKPEVTP